MNKVLKVISAGLLSAALAVSAAVSASAATGINASEEKILTALSGTVNLNGVATPLPTKYYNQAKNYFTSEVEITEAQATEIIEKINAVKAYLESTGVSKYSDLTDAQINQVVALSNEASGVVGVKLSYDKTGKNVKATTTDGKETGISTGDPIVNTGFDVPSVTVVAGLGIVLVSAAGVYLLKTSKKDEAC